LFVPCIIHILYTECAKIKKNNSGAKSLINVYYIPIYMHKYCATNRKDEGSIPDGVIGIFHWHNPSGRTMAQGLTQPLTKMSTKNISWGVKAAGA